MTDTLGLLESRGLLVSLGVVLQIFVIDLLLSADNALLIAMAVRRLPPDQIQIATIIGTLGAIILRLIMAVVVLFLLDVPYLKVVAGLLLLVIALRLTLERADPDTGPAQTLPRSIWQSGLAGAVATIVIADVVMSLDNVVAIAALANGSLILLGLGLAFSIPMLIYGSVMIRRFLAANQSLILVAGIFLGWIAGGIAVSDRWVAPWVASSAPALGFVVPFACAVFVLWENRILMKTR